MIRYNVEMKSFIRRFIALFFIAIVFGVATTFVNLKIIKSKVVENNQAIVGNILSKKPEMEDEIIDIITQGNSKENMDLGKEILAKYNYKDNISFENEVIINKSLKEILFPQEVKPIRLAGLRLFNVGGRTRWLFNRLKKN